VGELEGRGVEKEIGRIKGVGGTNREGVKIGMMKG